jgi:hypothetical protein
MDIYFLALTYLECGGCREGGNATLLTEFSTGEERKGNSLGWVGKEER